MLERKVIINILGSTRSNNQTVVEVFRSLGHIVKIGEEPDPQQDLIWFHSEIAVRALEKLRKLNPKFQRVNQFLGISNALKM